MQKSFKEKSETKKHIFKIVRLVSFLIISIILFIFSFNILHSDVSEKMFEFDRNKWILFSLFLVIIILNADELFIDTFKSLIHFKFDEKVLMTIASIAAYILGEYFEATMIVLLFNLGEAIEDYSNYKSSSNIQSLFNTNPTKANLLDLNTNLLTSINAKQLKVGQTIVIKPGEEIPVDCTIIKGSSSIDNSNITGEYKPCDVSENDYLHSGSININGSLTCLVEQTYDNSTVSQSIKLIKESEKNKSETQKFITKFAKIYTPIMIGISLLIFIIYICIDTNQWEKSLNTSLSILLTACPCAFVISIPIAYSSTIASMVKNSILIKGGKYLDGLAKTKTIIFDKTGTLTTGQLKINKIVSLNNHYTNKQIVELIASLELYSSHSLALAFKNLDNKKLNITNVKEIPGYGLIGKLDNKQVLCGNKKLMIKNKVEILDSINSNETIIYLAIENKIIGYVTLKDQIRHNAKNIIKKLKKIGVNNFYILSGDNQSVVDEVVQELNLTKGYGNLLPEDKVEMYKKIKNGNKNCVYVGDGLNDAPILKLADIGIAFDKGQKLIKTTADIIFMGDKNYYVTNSLNPIYDLIFYSKKTCKTILFNLYFIFIVKAIVFITILAISFYDNMATTQLILGLVSDVVLTLLTTLNSLRLLKR